MKREPWVPVVAGVRAVWRAEVRVPVLARFAEPAAAWAEPTESWEEELVRLGLRPGPVRVLWVLPEWPTQPLEAEAGSLSAEPRAKVSGSSVLGQPSLRAPAWADEWASWAALTAEREPGEVRVAVLWAERLAKISGVEAG